MFIIFRWWYFAGIAGLGLSVYGGIETSLSLQSSSEPIAVTIDDLENGKPIAQPYVRLGQHVALEPLGVRLEKGRSNRVEKVAYPLLAREHPYLRELAKPHSDTRTRRPELSDVHVFALRGGATPLGSLHEVDTVEGTVFGYEGLNSEERKMVEAIVPGLARDRVRVLEIGRRPKPLAVTIGMALAGLALIGFAIRLFRGVRPTKPKAAKAPKEPKDTEKPFLHEGLDKRRPGI